MSEASMPHCLICGRVEYDCFCDRPGVDGEPNAALDEFDRAEKSVIWAYGRLDYLRREKICKAGGMGITVSGLALYDQLCASGFKPSVEETIEALCEINGCEEVDIPRELIAMVYRYKPATTEGA